MEKDPEYRLGANGVKDIMDHDYFKGIDWEAMKRREVSPPYNPKIRSDKDVKHIDSRYLEENIVS